MPETCAICANPGGKPRDVIVELKHSYVTAPPRACLPGYVCLVARTHVVEPYELEDSGAWWVECMAVARALKRELGSHKLNYEIHGNTLAHLHMHIYPRFAGDPFQGKPIDGSAQLFDRTPDELDRLRTAVTA